MSEFVEIPDTLFEAGKPMSAASFNGPRAAYLEKLARLRAADTLIRWAEEPGDGRFEHSFMIELPTIAVPDGEDFDPVAYARDAARRITRQVSGTDFEVLLWQAPDPPYDEAMIMDAGGGYMRDDNRMPLKLKGVRLYTMRLMVECLPHAHGKFLDLELGALVADKRNAEAVATAWKRSTGKPQAPADIYLDNFSSGRVGALHERSYTVNYWEMAKDPRVGR